MFYNISMCNFYQKLSELVQNAFNPIFIQKLERKIGIRSPIALCLLVAFRLPIALRLPIAFRHSLLVHQKFIDFSKKGGAFFLTHVQRSIASTSMSDHLRKPLVFFISYEGNS